MATRKSSVFYGVLIALVSVVVGMVIASRLDLVPHSSAADLQIPPTNSAPIAGGLDATTFRDIAKQAGPSVVSIITTTRRSTGSLGGLFEQFGLPPGAAPEEGVPAQGQGSGFIIDEQGFILTNNHVIEDAESIEVMLSTMGDYYGPGYGLPAKVVGRDELTDTALIQLTQLPNEKLTVAKFGDSAQIAPGDWVMAVGNPFGLANTVTVGIVSAVGRDQAVSRGRSEEFIQTDAAINRGNSGGPLLNLRGEVIGINSMIYTSDSVNGGNMGVGFAVPINTVRDLLPQLRTGRVTRGRIGVYIERRPMTPDYAKSLGLSQPGGAEIQSVEADGPADDAGIKAGDVIVEFNGKTIRTSNDLVSIVAGTKPGTTVPAKVVRGGESLTLNVTVEELNLEAEQQVAEVEREPRGNPAETETSLGMSVQPLTPALRRQRQVPADETGVVVTSVTPFGPAAQEGLQPGDVILSVGGRAISSVGDLTAAVDALRSGQLVRMIIWRFTPGRGQGQGRGQESAVRLRKP